jgi:hypothetical protein
MYKFKKNEIQSSRMYILQTDFNYNQHKIGTYYQQIIN